MERKIENYTVREILESSLKGFSYYYPNYTTKTVFYNNTNILGNTKMFTGIFFNNFFYELKITMKRDRVEFNEKFNVSGDRAIIYNDFMTFINNTYPLFTLKKSHNKLYIEEYLHDYEISFVLKRGVT